MNRFARVALSRIRALAGPLLAGCGSFDPSSFDPTAIFDSEIFNTKKKLPGERKAVFPEGTPGVPQGVPPELVKGYQDRPRRARKRSRHAAAGSRPRPKPKPEPKPQGRGQAEAEESPPTAGRAAVRSHRNRRSRGPAQPQAAVPGPHGLIRRAAADGPPPAAPGPDRRSRGRGVALARSTARRADCAHRSRRACAACTRTAAVMSFTVAIVGRPNVGKSTLFNRLVGRRLALVDDRPGVTRDRREGRAQLGDLAFTRRSTPPGLDEAAPESLSGRMQAQTEAAIAGADAMLFVIDARAGPLPADRAFADLVRRSGKPAILVANKSEGRAAQARPARSLRARPRRAGRDLGRARRGPGRSLRRAARGAAGATVPRARDGAGR